MKQGETDKGDMSVGFQGVPRTVEYPALEERILAFWKETEAFEKLVAKNKGGPRWSFLDGPITANNPMGVHHAWGRTYKDTFQRYRAMQGFDQRYQNGFDCQGLWIEVEVERELGFKSKRDIEAYGVAEFVERCKQRVYKYAAIQTEQSVRLGPRCARTLLVARGAFVSGAGVTMRTGGNPGKEHLRHESSNRGDWSRCVQRANWGS